MDIKDWLISLTLKEIRMRRRISSRVRKLAIRQRRIYFNLCTSTGRIFSQWRIYKVRIRILWLFRLWRRRLGSGKVKFVSKMRKVNSPAISEN